MALESDAEIKEIQGRKGYSNDVVKPAADISTGVEHVVGNVPSFTIYLSASAAINVAVEVSPNGGTDWYELPESPVKFTAAGDDAVHVSYNCDRVRLTGSTIDPVKAQIREVM